jgi:WD40 repeat protein
MARDPDDRYGSMLELSEDLHAYLDDRVVSAHRTGAVVELRKWVRRNRGLAAGLILALGLAIAGLAGVSYVQMQARGAVEAKNRALEASNVALEEARIQTASALERAVAGEELARTNEAAALANEEEALWQSYVGNVGSALAALEIGSASEARRRLAACDESLRGWEWRYLNERADGSLRTLDDVTSFVYALAVSPVEPLAAASGGSFGDAGARDNAIRLWDHETGELLHVLEEHTLPVMTLVFSPGGDVLVSADSSGKVRLWDVQSGELIASPGGPFGFNVDYHPEGRRIAGASHHEGAVLVWDTYDRKLLRRELGIGTGANAVRHSPDGSLLALAGIDDRIRLLDAETFEVVRELDAGAERRDQDSARGINLRGPGVFDVDFSPDGRRLVSASGDGFVRTWDVETGERLGFFRGHRSKVLSVRWHPRGPWIVSSDEDGTIRFWDAETAAPLEVLRGHDGDVYALRFTALGDRLLSSSWDTTVRVWDGQPGATDTSLKGYDATWMPPYVAEFSPAGDRIVWRRGDRFLRVTDVLTGEDLATLWTDSDPSEPVGGVVFPPGGKEIQTIDPTGDVRRWNPETGACIETIELGTTIRSGAADPAFERAVLGYQEAVHLIDLRSEETLWSIEVEGVANQLFDPSGQRIVMVGDGFLQARDAATGEQLWHRDHPGMVMGLQIDPTGTWIATTTYNEWDQSVFLWNLEDGEHLETLVGHSQPAVLDLAPDGSRILTGNWDGTISLWSRGRGQVFTVQGHAGVVAAVAFSPDGTVLASLGQDGRARLWNATPAEARAPERRAAARRRRHAAGVRPLVEALFAERLHTSAVVEALEADGSLEPEEREAAVLAARLHGDEGIRLGRDAIRVAADPDSTPARTLRALEASRIALTCYPTSWLAFEVLGLVEMRMGLHAEAVVHLARAKEERAAIDRSDEMFPEFHLLRTLAYHAAGDAEEAARQLAIGRRMIQRGQAPWIEGLDLDALRAEAEAVVGD